MMSARQILGSYVGIFGIIVIILSLSRWAVFPCTSFRTDSEEESVASFCPFVDEDGDFLFSLSPGYYHSIPSAQTWIMAIFLFLVLPASGAIVMHRVLRQ